jgi:hypothetical protein
MKFAREANVVSSRSKVIHDIPVFGTGLVPVVIDAAARWKKPCIEFVPDRGTLCRGTEEIRESHAFGGKCVYVGCPRE